MIDPAVLLQLIHDLQARALEAEARAERAEAELVARSRIDNLPERGSSSVHPNHLEKEV